MATLQNTTVPDGGYYRVGNSANTAYISSGGSLFNFGNNAWFNGSSWQGGGGPALQLTSDTLKFYNNPLSSTTDVTFSISEATTTFASTTTTVVAAAGNSNVNSVLGVGAAAGTATTDGKIDGINYTKLTAVLVQGIKELVEILDKQQNQIDIINNKLGL